VEGDHSGYTEENTDLQNHEAKQSYAVVSYRSKQNSSHHRRAVRPIFTSRSVSLRDVFRKRSVAKG